LVITTTIWVLFGFIQYYLVYKILKVIEDIVDFKNKIFGGLLWV